MGPIDYTIQQPDFLGTAGRGFQIGFGIRQANEQRAAEQQAMQAAQAQAQQRKADLSAFYSNPSPGAADYRNLTVKYPDLAAQFKQAAELGDKAQRADRVNTGASVLSAIRSGKPEIAEDLLRKKAEAILNSGGSEEEADSNDRLAELIKLSPEMAEKTAGLFLAAADPDKFGETFAKIDEAINKNRLAKPDLAKAEAEALQKTAEAANAPAKLAADLRKADAEIRNVSSMVADRAARLNLDRDRLNLDIQSKLAEFANKPISAGAEKIVNDGVAASLASSLSADKFDELAGKLEKIRAAGGAAGGFSEYAAQVFGSKDEVSALRQEYTRLRSQLAISSLPPGPATDKDIEIAFKGFPKETDSPAYVAQFLRGTAKLQRIDSTVQEAKAQWAQQNGNLGNAKNGGEINGIPYKAGETLKEFTKRAIDSTSNAVPAQPISGGFRIVRVRPQ